MRTGKQRKREKDRDADRKIDKERFEVSILTTVPGEQSWRQRFEDYATDIFDLPSFLEPKDFPEFISYFIKSREVDVLFLSNSYDGYYLVPWLRAQFPKLAIIDYVHMEEWYWRNGGYARTSGTMGAILEKTYVCNERTRRVLINDFGRDLESVETLYIGVDQEQYDETKIEAGLVRKELNIAEDRPIILFPCRIHPQKRPFLMVEIAKQIKQSIPNIAFVVVGDGPQFEELKIAIERENLTETVYLAGRQKDMRPYYKDSALTLICSLKEGLALTAYESLSMSKPVVTSDVGGQAELIDDTVGRVLPLLQSPELTPDVCLAARALKAKQMLYMLTVLVDDTCAEESLQDDWMESVAQEARLCMYARRPGISPEKSEVLHRGIVAGRLETGKPVLLLDWDADITYLNHRISDNTVWGSALQEGQTFPLQLHTGE